MLVQGPGEFDNWDQRTRLRKVTTLEHLVGVSVCGAVWSWKEPEDHGATDPIQASILLLEIQNRRHTCFAQ